MPHTVGDAEETRTAAASHVDPVEAFYTRHPYPPPVANLDRARDEWRDENRHRAEHHLVWPSLPYRADIDILVAGCGTWQAAKYALCRPSARVVGIDVSPTSLEHTAQLKGQYNLTNLRVEQTSVEDVEALEARFDLIVCTGVLHHLADPDAGARALRAVLKPHGAIYLMLYAPYGRTGVSMFQDYCRRLGIGTSQQEIEHLVSVLKVLPRQHPLAIVLDASRDAQNADALADALLNPRERCYSVPQLLDFIDRNGLTFGRWYLQAPYLSRCGAMALTPHAARLAAMPERDHHAAMELWRGTMTCHSVIVYGSDGAEGCRPVCFDGEDWLRYVPIRLPSTLGVRERLPAGAAAVLLNRGHAYHDLILPITPQEEQLVNAIDGRRSIAEILDKAHLFPGARAKAFFEKLWSFDQVVIDSSHA